RIVVTNGGLQQPLRVGRGGRIDDLQPRSVQERRFRILRVEGTAAHVPSGWAADDDRLGTRSPVARRGDVVGDDVVGAGDEVDELHLHDRSHAHVGGTGGRARETDLRD